VESKKRFQKSTDWTRCSVPSESDEVERRGKGKRGEREERRKKSFLEGAPRWVARTKERAIDVEFRSSFLSFAPRSPAPGSAPDSGPHARWLGSSRLFTVFPRAGGSKALEGARGRRRRLHKGNIFSRRTCPLSRVCRGERGARERGEARAASEKRGSGAVFPGPFQRSAGPATARELVLCYVTVPRGGQGRKAGRKCPRQQKTDREGNRFRRR